jgi:hypothetical protein
MFDYPCFQRGINLDIKHMRERERERKRERFSRFSENSSRFSEKSFRFPRLVFREQIIRLEIREEKNIITRLVLGNGNGKTIVFNIDHLDNKTRIGLASTKKLFRFVSKQS